MRRAVPALDELVEPGIAGEQLVEVDDVVKLKLPVSGGMWRSQPVNGHSLTVTCAPPATSRWLAPAGMGHRVSRRQTGQRKVHRQDVCGPVICRDDSSARITTSPQTAQLAL